VGWRLEKRRLTIDRDCHSPVLILAFQIVKTKIIPMPKNARKLKIKGSCGIQPIGQGRAVLACTTEVRFKAAQKVIANAKRSERREELPWYFSAKTIRRAEALLVEAIKKGGPKAKRYKEALVALRMHVGARPSGAAPRRQKDSHGRGTPIVVSEEVQKKTKRFMEDLEILLEKESKKPGKKGEEARELLFELFSN